MEIGAVATGLKAGSKYRRPYMGTKYVQVKEVSEGVSIVALVREEGSFHKYVCPGDDIIADDWVEVTI